MTWRVPPYDRAIEALLSYVRATYSPRGIVVSGSIVRGEAGPLSDFDVFVVHDEGWRVRDQRRFEGVPSELFVAPPAQVRRYFASEHDSGRPSTAHMFATGEALEPVDPVVAELVREGREWLAKPVVPTPARLERMRYAAVDILDDARDVITRDGAGDGLAAHLLLGEVVRLVIEYAFWRAGQFQPRRKRVVAELAAVDPDAAELVRQWASIAAPGPGPDHNERASLGIVERLAQHVLGVDGFFEWSSEREVVAT